MTWFSALPEGLIGLSLIFLPGLAVLAAWRIRPLVLFSASSAMSVVIFTLSAFGAQLTGSAWNVVWVLAFVALFAAAGLVIAHLTKADGFRKCWTDVREWRRLGVYSLGIAIGFSFFLGPMLRALISPQSISQTYDNGFHLNAVSMVARGDGASPIQFGAIGGGSFYPAGWHEWAGLAAQLNSGDVTAAVQACSIVVALIVWPMSLAWLYETIFPANNLGRLAVGTISMSWGSLTFGFLNWGTLYPNLLGMAVMPAAVAAGWELLGLSKRPYLGFAGSLGVLLVVCLGTAFAHPNATFTAGAFLVLPAFWSVIRPGGALGKNSYRMPRNRENRIWSVVVFFVITVFVLAWGYASKLTDYPWPAVTGSRYALSDALFGAVTDQKIMPTLTLALAAGTIAIIRNKKLWVVFASHMTVVAVYVVCAGFQPGMIRRYVSGLYYNDFRRPAAAIATLLLPITAYGIQRVGSIVWLWIRARFNLELNRTIAFFLSVAMCIPIGYLVSHNSSIRHQVDKTKQVFAFNENSEFLTPRELKLLKRLPDYVPADVTVVNNPWDGSIWTYAFSGRLPLTTSFQKSWAHEPYLINHELENVATDPEVCDSLKKENAQYVVLLKDPFKDSGEDHVEHYVGLDEIPEMPGFKEVDQEGGSKLYKITACDF